MVTRLNLENNIDTKKLYEAIFTEDTEVFIDYYYNEVASGNVIYTVGDKSMLHLNPYEMYVYGHKMMVNYIVAVATRVDYRKQGLMRQLMTRALKDMYIEEQGFTYLMPASEAIYEPYDFVVVGAQQYYRGSDELLKEMGSDIIVTEASIEDCEELAIFTNEILKKRSKIYTLHTVEYYKRMLKEQNAQNGGIKIYRSKDAILGLAIYSNEGELKFRDVIKRSGVTLPLEYSDNQNIMVRIVNVRKLLSCVPLEVIKDKGLDSFNLVDRINEDQTGNYQLNKHGIINFRKKIYGEQFYTIGELTKLVFENTSVVLNEIV